MTSPIQPPGATVTNVPEVLFVCVHNAGRSQMSAALLAHHAAGRVQVRSAGSTPAKEINPAVAAAMAELGLDVERNKLGEASYERGSPAGRCSRAARAGSRAALRGSTPPLWTSPRPPVFMPSLALPPPKCFALHVPCYPVPEKARSWDSRSAIRSTLAVH